jgi:hypothetical protein
MLPELVRRLRPAALMVAEYAGNGAYGLRHPSLLRSGATASDQHRRLPGDELVPHPNWQPTRAETIRAPAAAVWPWLVQLGYGRGGYYGDLPWWRGERGRGPAASADRILPEFQHLDLGDVLLDGSGCDATHGAWTVRVVEPGGSLVLFSSRTLDGREVDPRAEPKPRLFFDCSWAFVLVPTGEAVTREGVALLALAAILYGRHGRSWWLFVALLPAPDLGLLGNLWSRRAGAVAHDLTHTYLPPVALGAVGVLTSSGLAVALALVWFAHIGMDRARGLGLQYPDGSGCTHLRASRRASNHPRPGGARWNA